MPSSRTKCLKCGRCFRRLDTHLRVSATCRDVGSPQKRRADTPSMPMNIISSVYGSVHSNFSGARTDVHSNISGTQTGNLNSTVHDQQTTTYFPVTTSSINKTSNYEPLRKANLCLPTSAEGWKEADQYFQTFLVPVVLAVSSPQEMNKLLCEGIYSYFASSYGTKPTPRLRPRKRPPHNRSLKEVEKKKKEAKRNLDLLRGMVPLMR